MGSTRAPRFSPPLAINLKLNLPSNREQQGDVQESPAASIKTAEERHELPAGDEDGQPIPSSKASYQHGFGVVPTAPDPETAGASKVKSSPEQPINVQDDDAAPLHPAGRRK